MWVREGVGSREEGVGFPVLPTLHAARWGLVVTFPLQLPVLPMLHAARCTLHGGDLG